MNMEELLEKMVDLELQARTEKSHFYVAATLREAIMAIIDLRQRLDQGRARELALSTSNPWEYPPDDDERPCEVCEGSGEIVKNDRGGDPEWDYSIPCPECSPKDLPI